MCAVIIIKMPMGILNRPISFDFIQFCATAVGGPFLDMWKELVRKYPAITQLVSENNCHISFEMYGMRNAHLIIYDVDLLVAILFGILSVM